MPRELIVRVTIDDCEEQTFRAGGPGGQNQNKRNTGVRLIHHPSGARGECRETRSQGQNRKIAFKRMAESAEFQAWVRHISGHEELPPAASDECVRTYHFVDKRVKDHRSGKQTSNLQAVLNGDLDLLH